MNKEQFERNLDHAKASYANAQEAIRFVDSKTAILTGLVLVSTGLPFALLQLVWSGDLAASPVVKWLELYHTSHPWLLNTKIVLGLIGSLCGVLSILASTNGLMARLPRKGSQKDPNILVQPLKFLWGLLPFVPKAEPPRPSVTCLFPLHDPRRVQDARRSFQKLGRGDYDETEILGEYEQQLECVGAILNVKINRNREAVGWFEVQILVYGLCATAFFVAWLVAA